MDWRFPGYFHPDLYADSAEQLRQQYHRQLDQLASHYGKLDILWFDGGGNDWLSMGGMELGGGGWRTRAVDKHYSGSFDWQDAKAVAHFRELQPDSLVNDRTDAPADFRVREGDGALGGFENRYPGELNFTIVEGPFGYKTGAKVKSLKYLVHKLVGAAGRDGNTLLNVGPMADGQIAPDQAARLREMGQWLSTAGESIYDTRGGPWLPEAYGVSTHRGKSVYVHLLKPPANETVTLPALPIRVARVSLLSGSRLEFQHTGGKLVIRVSSKSQDPIDTILKVELEQPWATSTVIPVPGPGMVE